MKNVLWLASWYPNRLDNFDGDFIQRHAQAVAAFCNVHVIYVIKDLRKTNSSEETITHSGNLTEQVIYYHPPVTGIRIIDRLLSFKKYNQTFRKAINAYITKNGKPNFVHVQVAMKAGLPAIWLKRRWNIPFILTEHWTGYYGHSVPSLYDHSGWYKKMNSSVLREASKLLPVSKSLAEEIIKNVGKVPYQVIPNVVNTNLFFYKSSTPEKFRFIHISYMNYQKNPEGIIKAAALLKEKGCDFEILMLGNDNEALRSMANKHGLSNEFIFFQQPVAYSEVAVQMQKASALLLFSRFENLPCVILEALCCGLPVISSRVGGVAEVIDKENGLLVKSENIQQLVNAMECMIDSYHDFDKAKIADNASALFNYNAVGKAIFENYG